MRGGCNRARRWPFAAAIISGGASSRRYRSLVPRPARRRAGAGQPRCCRSNSPDRRCATPTWRTGPLRRAVARASAATYLSWLASDRNLVQLPIGYVFLYFYGFERRVFLDLLGRPDLAAELPWIRAEVERLRRVYGSNPSLNGYAQRFLWATECLGGEPGDLAEPPVVAARSWRIPDAIKLGLGSAERRRASDPGELGPGLAQIDPEAFIAHPGENAAPTSSAGSSCSVTAHATATGWWSNRRTSSGSSTDRPRGASGTWTFPSATCPTSPALKARWPRCGNWRKSAPTPWIPSVVGSGATPTTTPPPGHRARYRPI